MRLEQFQLIDRVVEFDREDRSIRCEAIVPLQASIFEGHFPGYPLMPGVLLIETMAQASGWLIIALQEFRRMAFLAAVRDAKFRTFVPPGAKMLVSANLVHDGSGFAVTRAQAEIDGKVACDANITFRVTDFPNDEIKRAMRDYAARVEFPVELATDD